MDIQLLVLLALLLVAMIVATRHHSHSRAWPGRPGWQYQRVFSVGFAGLLFSVSGVIGWDLSHSHGWFHGTKWVDGPVWWQIGLGASLLALAMFWARRVPLRTGVAPVRSRRNQ